MSAPRTGRAGLLGVGALQRFPIRDDTGRFGGLGLGAGAEHLRDGKGRQDADDDDDDHEFDEGESFLQLHFIPFDPHPKNPTPNLSYAFPVMEASARVGPMHCRRRSRVKPVKITMWPEKTKAGPVRMLSHSAKFLRNLQIEDCDASGNLTRIRGIRLRAGPLGFGAAAGQLEHFLHAERVNAFNRKDFP